MNTFPLLKQYCHGVSGQINLCHDSNRSEANSQNTAVIVGRCRVGMCVWISSRANQRLQTWSSVGSQVKAALKGQPQQIPICSTYFFTSPEEVLQVRSLSLLELQSVAALLSARAYRKKSPINEKASGRFNSCALYCNCMENMYRTCICYNIFCIKLESHT